MVVKLGPEQEVVAHLSKHDQQVPGRRRGTTSCHGEPALRNTPLRAELAEVVGGELIGRLGFMAVAEHIAWRDSVSFGFRCAIQMSFCLLGHAPHRRRISKDEAS